MNRLLLAGLIGLAGCGQPADTGVDTGARDAARGFYEAIVRKDWSAAYAAVHPDAAKGLGPAEFTRRAEAYRAKLGFEPTAVHVRAGEEAADRATVRVELTGPGAGKHRYKDTAVLRPHDGGWRVVPPPRFGLK